MGSMRRVLAMLAGSALLCAAPAVAAAGSKAPPKRAANASPCAAIKKKAMRRRCLRSRAAFTYVHGRAAARLPAGATLVGAPAAGGGSSSVADGAASATAPAESLAAGPLVAPVAGSTVGVEAHDFGTFALRLTKTAVPAGNLTIFFRNYDASQHNLWMQAPQSGAQPVQISDNVGEGQGATKTVVVTPGTWRLYCAIEGHDSMTRNLAVG
jgi:plastocyanin